MTTANIPNIQVSSAILRGLLWLATCLPVSCSRKDCKLGWHTN